MDEFEPALVPAILLSDHVIREMGAGKLTLVGIFSQWNCPNFPYQTPPFWIIPFIGNLKFAPEELNVTVKIEQCGSGHSLASAAGKVKFSVKMLPPEALMEIPFRIQSVFFPQPGSYRIVVLVNDEKVGERIIVVAGITSPILPQ